MVHPVDKLVGQRIRSLRHLLSMSQTDLAQKVGIKFQQIQKYETGANRVSASRLSEIAKVMKVQISHFFDEDWNGRSVELDKEALEVVAMFSRLTPAKKKTIVGLIKEL